MIIFNRDGHDVTNSLGLNLTSVGVRNSENKKCCQYLLRELILSYVKRPNELRHLRVGVRLDRVNYRNSMNVS